MSQLLANIQWSEIGVALVETLGMVLSSTLFATLVGLPLGVLLVLTGPGHLLPRPALHRGLSATVNALRSTPFIILMILCMPLTKLLVGTSLGPRAAVVPLVVGAAPFFARLVEVALREVEKGAIDMGLCCGATTWQLIWHVLLPEARAGILAGITITAVALVGYSAMAGVVGGGGLGDLAIRYGYQRFQTDVMLLTTALLVVLVQIFQGVGDTFVKHFSRK
jgi:D-methionine transport system permease protein